MPNEYTARYCPDRKRGYGSKKQAKNARWGKVQSVYLCQHCNMWHITKARTTCTACSERAPTYATRDRAVVAAWAHAQTLDEAPVIFVWACSRGRWHRGEKLPATAENYEVAVSPEEWERRKANNWRAGGYDGAE